MKECVGNFGDRDHDHDLDHDHDHDHDRDHDRDRDLRPKTTVKADGLLAVLEVLWATDWWQLHIAELAGHPSLMDDHSYTLSAINGREVDRYHLSAPAACLDIDGGSLLAEQKVALMYADEMLRGSQLGRAEQARRALHGLPAVMATGWSYTDDPTDNPVLKVYFDGVESTVAACVEAAAEAAADGGE
jgi:hypothetical protein